MTNETMKDGERAAFEAWAIQAYELKSIERYGDGYRFTGVDDAWSGWKARAASPQSGEKGDPFPYQKTFNAIAAATSIEGGHIAISVRKFCEAFGEARPAAPQAALTDEACEAIRQFFGTAHSNEQILALLATPPTERMSDAARDVLAERARQVSEEGWTPEHDDEHDEGEMASAAAAYAARACGWNDGAVRDLWPPQWHLKWLKPTTPRGDLVKAGGLILAEIERIDRAGDNHG